MSAVVTLDRVSKRFVLQHHKARSFQDALVNFVHRRTGTTEEFWALKDVSVEVHPGETLGIIGQNGSGKSTILKLITRILDPTSGRVAVDGMVSALIELGAGFHPDLTGRENVYLNGSIMGFGRREMDRKLDEIVAFSELERFIDTPVKHYSSGMYARLGFSVAISVNPDILIIDEVLSVGDEGFQRKCLDKIAEFRRRGKTIIFVSHGMSTVEQLCDRVIWLHHGVLKGQGAASRVVRAYLEELQRKDEENRELAHQAEAAEHAMPVDLNGHHAAPAVGIRAAELLAAEGKEKYSFRTGETMIVRIHYRVADPTAAYVVGLELRRNDGFLIHSSSQNVDGQLPTDGNGGGWIDAEIENLPLLAGTYYVVPSLNQAGSTESGPHPDAHHCSFSVWSDVDQIGIIAISYRLPPVGELSNLESAVERASTGIG